MSDSPQVPPKKRRLRSDPLGLGAETPSRDVGLDPLGLGKAPAIDPLALAQELLAQSEPPPQAPLRVQRPNPIPRMEPLELSREVPDAPLKLSLDKVGDQKLMTRKMPALQGPEPVEEARLELPLERVSDLSVVVTPETRAQDLAILPPCVPAQEPQELAGPDATARPAREGSASPARPAGDWSVLPTAAPARRPVTRTQSQPAVRPERPPEPGSGTHPGVRPQSRPPVRKLAEPDKPQRISHTLRLRRLLDRRLRVSSDDLVVFTRQFSAMVSSGLQLHQSLYFYAQNEPDMELSKVVHEVADRVGDGNSLSNSMRCHPEVFSEVYTGLISAGESTGMLHLVLNKLADLSEKNQRLHKKVWATLTYPLVLMVVSTLCVLAFLYFVLPMLVPLFSTLGVTLPLPTRMLLQFSALMQNPITFGVVTGTLVGTWLFWPSLRRAVSRHPQLLRSMHRIPLELPVLGRMVDKVITARIMFSMATLLDSGYALSGTLEKCEKVAGNAEIAWRLREARRMLVEGASAAECLGKARVFPNGAIQMIAVGEETAALSEMIGRVAQVYEDDVEMALMDMAAMLEPLILIVMGVVVGFIVLAAVLPTVSLLDKL